jgi:hypothetical protein
MVVALIWICYSLRNDKKVKGNDKFMAIHIGLCLVLLATQVINIVERHKFSKIEPTSI